MSSLFLWRTATRSTDDDAEGFSIRAELELKGENGWWYGSARGLYAGVYAYVVFETGVWVLDLETLEPVTTVEW